MLIDTHIGIARWREQWITNHCNLFGFLYNKKSNDNHNIIVQQQQQHQQRRIRIRGVWDTTIIRKYITLKDNRTITYFLDGPVQQQQQQQDEEQQEQEQLESKGTVPYIFVFHAMFLSGNSFILSDPPKDYILVCINRPGYFGSDLPRTTTTAGHNEYTYKTFASDIEQLANHLQITKFYVVGHSSGGPYALACAAYLPQRVIGIGLLSSDPEYANEHVPNKRFKNRILLGYILPFVLYYTPIGYILPFARGARLGLVTDYKLETSSYPFCTEDIHHNTICFVGAEDTVMPLDISRHVHHRLQCSQWKIIPSIGHMGLLRDFVLQDLFESLLYLNNNNDDNDNENEQTSIQLTPAVSSLLSSSSLDTSTAVATTASTTIFDTDTTATTTRTTIFDTDTSSDTTKTNSFDIVTDDTSKVLLLKQHKPNNNKIDDNSNNPVALLLVQGGGSERGRKTTSRLHEKIV